MHVVGLRYTIPVYNTCTLLLNNEKYVDANLVGWLVVFYVPSTARSFRDDTPIPVLYDNAVLGNESSSEKSKSNIGMKTGNAKE